MNIKSILFLLAIVLMVGLNSCKDRESYADLLNTERHATNAYLAGCRVVNEVPSDTVFEVGKDAPYYRLDKEGNVHASAQSRRP